MSQHVPLLLKKALFARPLRRCELVARHAQMC